MGPITRFEELGQRGVVEQRVVDTLTRQMNLHTMTQVQSLTINEAIKGVDVLAQAKTGTGKTIGFLLPVLQRILGNNPELARPERGRRRFGSGRSSTLALIISPTRELAEQIANETRRLVAGTGVLIQTAVGGTQKSSHLRDMVRNGCHILVGTPGRLKDLLSSEIEAPQLQSLVLDEADRLMDQGFWPEIQEIMRLLPDRRQQDRQTLLFSATVPPEVVEMARKTLKPNMHYVRTVQEDETPTHERVKQMLVPLPGLENGLPTVLELFERFQREHSINRSTRPFKAILYHNSTAETTLSYQLLLHLRQNAHLLPESLRDSAFFHGTRVYSIHSRLTQSGRTYAADNFRNSKSAILCSSDVTARGMDFPGVTHVIQLGLPPSREQYIHRLGRTARAGAEGEGWLLIPRIHSREMRFRLGRLQMDVVGQGEFSASSLDTAEIPEEQAEDDARQLDNPYMQSILAASKDARLKHTISEDAFDNAYLGTVGTWGWNPSRAQTIQYLNRWSRWSWGMMRPPTMSRTLASKIGFAGIPGVNLSDGIGRTGARDREFDGDRRSGARGFDGDRRGGDRGDRGYSDRGRSFDAGNRGYGSSDRGYGGRGRSFDAGNRGYGSSDTGYGGRDRGSGGGRRFGSDGGRRGDYGDSNPRSGQSGRRSWEGRGRNGRLN